MDKHLFGDTTFNIIVAVVVVITFIIARILKKKNKIRNYFIVLVVPILMYIGKWYTIKNDVDVKNNPANHFENDSRMSSISQDSAGSSTTELSDLFSLDSSN